MPRSLPKTLVLGVGAVLLGAADSPAKHLAMRQLSIFDSLGPTSFSSFSIVCPYALFRNLLKYALEGNVCGRFEDILVTIISHAVFCYTKFLFFHHLREMSASVRVPFLAIF